jgi:hypothetical protein
VGGVAHFFDKETGMTTNEWHSWQLAMRRQAEEEEILRYRQWQERLEKKMRASRAAREAAAAKAAPANAGVGWRVIENPQTSHAVLEERAHAIHAFVWHEEDFPEGWRFRWGQLDDTLLSLAGAAEVCAARSAGRVLGLAVMNHQIILLDEENQRGRPVRDIVKTIVHELCHVKVRNTVHGPQFQRALKSAMTYYDHTPGAPALASAITSVLASAARPTPRVGVRYPFPDSQIEYRG